MKLQGRTGVRSLQFFHVWEKKVNYLLFFFFIHCPLGCQEGFGFLFCPISADACGPYKASASPQGWLPGEGENPWGGLMWGHRETSPWGLSWWRNRKKHFASCTVQFFWSILYLICPCCSITSPPHFCLK